MFRKPFQDLMYSMGLARTARNTFPSAFLVFSLVELSAKPLVQCYLPLIFHVLKITELRADSGCWFSPHCGREAALAAQDTGRHSSPRRGALLRDKWPVEAELQDMVSWIRAGRSLWEAGKVIVQY